MWKHFVGTWSKYDFCLCILTLRARKIIEWGAKYCPGGEREKDLSLAVSNNHRTGLCIVGDMRVSKSCARYNWIL